MWKGNINAVLDESLEDSSKNNKAIHSSLERCLAPLSKLTYYGGLLFDWYRPIKNQSFLSITFRCILIAIVFSANAFEAASCLVQFGKMVQNDKTQIQELVSEANEVTIQLVILFTWIYFLCRRNSMTIFFTDWEKLQPTLLPGGTNSDHQQPITTIRVIIGVYLVYGLFGTGYICYVIICAFSVNDNVFISYFPSQIECLFFSLWCRFTLIVKGLSFGLFYALLDIVPMTVYYHGSKMIQAVNVDLEEMNMIESKVNNNKDVVDGLERIWSRFENLRVLLQRADHLFGFLMILSNGDAFLGICATFYSFLNYYVKQSDFFIEDLYWEFLTCFLFCFFLTRMIISVILVSKVSSSSSQLLSTAAFLSLHRCRLPENKEERRIMKSLLGRLESNPLAARPSGLYNITPSLFLTMLSLIVSYTIILLQSNNNFPLNYLINASRSAA